MFWSKGVSWKWGIPMLPAVIAFVIGKDLYNARVRGRDLVALAGDGIRVTNRKRVWTIAWREIQTVHRFKEQLVFETFPPHRRETLSLEGHEEHQRDLAAAISERARTLNLTWVETLTDIFADRHAHVKRASRPSSGERSPCAPAPRIWRRPTVPSS